MNTHYCNEPQNIRLLRLLPHDREKRDRKEATSLENKKKKKKKKRPYLSTKGRIHSFTSTSANVCQLNTEEEDDTSHLTALITPLTLSIPISARVIPQCLQFKGKGREVNETSQLAFTNHKPHSM